ncbi:uncharacterized protein [Elaeis guineensis]|uniref:uncharacterized protein isoform X2 n=1 Tax=Elaeis guineensis var. tenera TaxID=51953 RepID=UPI003C6D919E
MGPIERSDIIVVNDRCRNAKELDFSHSSCFHDQDPLKNGVLAVQTVRNNIMASTVLATTAITLASLISVFVAATTTNSAAYSLLVYGNKTAPISSVKFFAISLCFILAFLCNVQSIRYYAHVSFLLVVPAAAAASRDGGISVAYVSRSLNKGSFFWSLGLRAFYVSFTLFLWIFGSVPMLAGSVVMCCLLYFLDTTTEYTRDLHDSFGGHEEARDQDA